MLIRDLIADIGEVEVSGLLDIPVEAISYDSRQVTPQSLFVAVPAVGGPPSSGGSLHVASAISNGAVAIVTEVDLVHHGVTTIRVKNARAALADLACAFFGHPTRDLQLFGITGTDGKTTTSYFLEHILATHGYKTGLIGTVETRFLGEREPNPDRMTTPESLDLQQILRRMVDAGVTHAVVEASSHALSLHRLRGCRFAAVAMTNITGDHIEFHGSWEAYFAAKASLFTEIGATCPAVLNADDPSTRRIISARTGPLLLYGVDSASDLRASSIHPLGDGSMCNLSFDNETTEMHVPLPGEYNVSNALAATGVALTMGLSLSSIAACVADAEPPPGRFQRVDQGQPFEILIDYAHTVHAFRSVLAALRARTPAPRRLIAVFGAAGDRDTAKRPLLAQIAHEYADFFVITNEDPFGEDADSIIDQIVSGISPQDNGVRYARESDRGRAIQLAVARAQSGDTVVILGKGHERSIVVAGNKIPWSDVSAVEQALHARV